MSVRRGRLANRSLLPGLFALALFLLPLSGPARAAAADFQLSADSIEHDLGAGIVTASGGVRVQLAEMEARGNLLRADLSTHILSMEGPVLVATPSGAVQGEDLRYAWDQRTGSLRNAQFASEGVRFSGGEAEFAASSWTLHDGLLTKCVYPTPEYALQAREIAVDPERQVAYIRGGRLALFGHTILPLPNLRLSLQDTEIGRLSRGNLPVPETGYDSERGYFLAQRQPLYLSDTTFVLAQAGYGSEEGARLGLSGLYTPSSAAAYRWDLVYQQRPPVADGLIRAEAAPAIHGTAEYELKDAAGRLKLGVEKKDDEARRDLTFLPRVEVSPRPVTVAGVTLVPTLEWANIQEEASGQAATRTLAGLSWSAAPRLSLPFALTFSGAEKQTWYGTGEALTTRVLSGAVTQPLTEALRLQTGVNVRQYTGRTPFVFDQPDRYSEGEVGLAWQSGGNTLYGAAAYDLAGWGTADGTRALPGQPAALKASAILASEGWRASAEVRYELGEKPHYSTAELELTRVLHCFEVTLSAEPVEKKIAFEVSFR
ncbi:MAG: hypothetical protein ACM3RP_04415 [Chitinophagales bacterium]